MPELICDLTVINQIIYNSSSIDIVADSRNILKTRFTFKGDVWSGLTKTALFIAPDGTAYKVLLVDDMCVVPHEVIKAPSFGVSVYGGDLLTASLYLVTVHESGYADGVDPAEPTPDVYNQLVETVQAERGLALAAAEAANTAAGNAQEIADTVQQKLDNGEFIGPKGDKGDPGEITQAVFDAHALDTDNPHEVTAAQVGLGNVDNTSDADKLISGANLTTQYNFKAYLNNNEDLNTIKNTGSYLVNTAQNKPITGIFILEVVQTNARWIIQTAYNWDTPNIVYRRKVDGSNNTATVWYKSFNGVADLPDKAITRAKIADIYMYNGVLAGVDLNTITKEGAYVSTSPLMNKPSQSKSGSNGFIKISNFGSFTMQEYIDTADTTKIWRRIIRNPDVIRDWYPVITSISHLQNKKCVCFGDSITEFGNYPDIIASRTGMTTYNVGFGGCRMSYTNTGDYNEFSMYRLADAIASGVWTAQDAALLELIALGDDNTAILNRLKAIDFSTVDYITINYGTSDFSGSVPIGTDSDTDGTTFKGSLNHIIYTLLTAYPHLKIALISPAWRGRISSGDGKDADLYANASGIYLTEYVDAEIEIAKLHKIPALDMYRTSGINKYTNTTYLSDGLHCTTAGYELIGNKISSFILSNY